MSQATAMIICSQWGAPIKTVLLVFVTVILLAVAALLVVEIIGKRELPETRTAQPRREILTAYGEPEPAPVPEPVPTFVAPEPEPEREPEPEIELKQESELEDDDDVSGGTMIVGSTRVRVLYDRSFTAMLIQSDDTLKGYYNDIRNELNSYGLKQRMSWNHESLYKGRTTYVKFAIRGKTLSVYLALDPSDYADSKYSFKDVSKVNKYRDVPMQVKIRSDRAVRRAKELIVDMAEKHGLLKSDVPKRNYHFDYETTKALVIRKLIKLKYAESEGKTRQELECAAAASIKLRDKAPRDFSTKLMRADGMTKERYSAIKNELLRYGMKPRMSTSYESWYIGRTTYAKFAIRGKTLTLFMALDPKDFEGTKYNFRDMSKVGKYETVPMRINLKSDRSVRWVKELIATLADKKGWQRADLGEEDFRYVKKTRTKRSEPKA